MGLPDQVEPLTSASTGLAAVRIDGDQLYWLESRRRPGRPHQRCGGGPLARRRADRAHPGARYVRNRVHEYGGGEYDVAGGVVVYSEFTDGRVYRLRDGDAAVPITPPGAYRYGDLRLHPDRRPGAGRPRGPPGDGEPVNTIVALDLDGANADGGGTVLCSGADFYSTPELSGRRPAGLDRVGPPEHALGPDHDQDRARSAGRAVERRVRGRRRPGESAVQPRWLRRRADLRLRPQQLVEPLSRGATARPARCTRRDAEFCRAAVACSGRRRTRSSTMISCCAP